MWLRCFRHLACHNVTASRHGRIRGASGDCLMGYSPTRLQRKLFQPSIVNFNSKQSHTTVTDLRVTLNHPFGLSTGGKPMQSVSILLIG